MLADYCGTTSGRALEYVTTAFRHTDAMWFSLLQSTRADIGSQKHQTNEFELLIFLNNQCRTQGREAFSKTHSARF